MLARDAHCLMAIIQVVVVVVVMMSLWWWCGADVTKSCGIPSVLIVLEHICDISRVTKVTLAFCCPFVSMQQKLSLKIKLDLYTSLIVSTAIYACETWKSMVRIHQKLDVFHQCNLR